MFPRLELDTVYRLHCGVQSYAWGGKGTAEAPPYIARLLGERPAHDQAYAELWIGAHPKMPAQVSIAPERRVDLNTLIAEQPVAILGPAAAKLTPDQSLPFLLKILDAAQPLSIQAHPDKNLAQELHLRDPQHYPDANHKPEIAIAIKDLDALCQFRPATAIIEDVRRLQPLTRFFRHLSTATAPDRQWLQQAYGRIFLADDDAIRKLLAELHRTIQKLTAPTPQDLWFLKLLQQYPGDRGTLSVYFLNLVHLQPGEAIFLEPNEPHAYLNGTIIECMASSDNVVRAGLTPKFIDREVLTSMLTYRQGPPEIMRGLALAPGEQAYQVPVPEFQVEIYRHAAKTTRRYTSDAAVSVLLVLDGAATFHLHDQQLPAPQGSAWLWPAALKVCNVTFEQDDTVLVRARPGIISGEKPDHA